MSCENKFWPKLKDTISTISDWELKFVEYAAMANLTIHNRCLIKFKQEGAPYIEYIMQYRKYNHLQSSF